MRGIGQHGVRRILCVFPRYTSSFGTFEHAYPLTGGVQAFMPPQGLLLIAAYLPADWKVRFIDENIRFATDEDFEWAEAVFVSGMHIQRQQMNDICRRAHAFNLSVALGGPSVSACPDYYPSFDYLHVGELGDATDELIERLARDLPEVELWIDHGANRAEAVAAMLARHPRAVVVVGSETLGEVRALADIARARAGRIALSLDFKGDAFLGPAALLDRPDAWPSRIIVMTLAAVGSDAGPDLARLAQMRNLAGPSREIYAAGGVRHLADCRALAAAGVSGALVASALHAGKLKADDLGEIAGL